MTNPQSLPEATSLTSSGEPDVKPARLTRAERNARAMSVAHLENTLGRRTLQGGGLMAISNVLRLLIQLASLAVLGRILLPDDFGLLAMSWAVLGFVTMFAELGLSTATIQRQEIDQNTTSVLFFMGLGVGTLVCLILMALAPLAAMLFNEPRLTLVVAAMALVIPVNMLATQHFALLARTMRWLDLEIGAVTSQALCVVAAILLAIYTPIGYWALVAQAWIGSLSYSLFLIWRCDWRPSWPTHWRAAASSVMLGVNLTGFTVMNYFQRTLDQVLIGWRWGTIELGFYARAYALLQAPINFVNVPIAKALQPALSRLQDKPEEWRAAFLAGLGALVILSGGFTAVLFGGAGPVIRTVYGPGWDQTQAIFGWLALSMALATPMNAVNWIYISLGRTGRMFQWGLWSTPVYVLAFVVGLPYGGTGVAIAYSTAVAILFIPCFVMATRQTSVTVLDVLKVIWPMSVAAVLVGIVLRMMTHEASAIMGVAYTVLGGLAYLCVALLLVMTLPVYASIRTYGLEFAGGFLKKLRKQEAGEA
ncbi:lipopolysaccharide biosynthesis protein [Hyphomonas sp.]|uniref:lipopolysaccharide biosynthesis protein n=1 Tax=Hyphomonas sp. TaxID=87 RepID=UPI00391DE193